MPPSTHAQSKFSHIAKSFVIASSVYFLVIGVMLALRIKILPIMANVMLACLIGLFILLLLLVALSCKKIRSTNNQASRRYKNSYISKASFDNMVVPSSASNSKKHTKYLHYFLRMLHYFWNNY